MYLILILLLLIFGGILLFLQHPQFGNRIKGAKLKQMEVASQFQNGSFKNLEPTPNFAEDASFLKVLSKFLFHKKVDVRPTQAIPSQKTDLHTLNPEENVLIWFGHSSYFLQVDGKCFLVDPVLSGSASPLPFGTKAFPGSDVYKPEDIPEIDFLIISHDHWDHLDYATILELQPKVKQVITGLGVGAHFALWGYDSSLVREMNWNESFEPIPGFTFHALPARHFSGRSYRRNETLWASFALQTPNSRIFLGGDSGYGEHLAEIGRQYGPFDLAVLENGQYDAFWPHIHMLPNQQVQTAIDLKATRVLPVHSCKFALANHPWYEPLELIAKHFEQSSIQLLTPLIGEKLCLDQDKHDFSPWWRALIPVE